MNKIFSMDISIVEMLPTLLKIGFGIGLIAGFILLLKF